MNLPEYEGNAYIAGLPAIEGPQRIFETLSRPPSWDASDRQLSPVLRRHCVQRLKRYFRPGPRHVMLAEEFGMMLRNGYLGRDPSDGRHEAVSLRIGEQARDGVLLSGRRPAGVDGDADCGVLVGMPGMGKTLTVKEVLRTYPQIIEHPGIPPQITYLRLDTPPKGSLRGLCVGFFGKVDELLGQDTYTRLYAGQHATEETMLSNMALVARFHGLGCLVVDEIQHLPRGGDEDHALLTFLVTLANTMGVPVLFIGTMKASRLFERTARMARRSVGNFGGPWERYAPDSADWKAFLDDLWQYRWTTKEVGLDQRLRAAIYEETQGVVDLAVKLMMRVQMRLILRTECNPAFPEEIDVDFVRTVADLDFKPVRGFVDALRSGDRDRINAYEDLSDFQAKFDGITDELVAQPRATLSTPQRRDEAVQPGEMVSVDRAVRDELRRRGLESDVIDKLVDDAKVELGQEEPGLMALLAAIEKILSPKSRRKAAAPVSANLVEGDLRRIAAEAVDGGRTVHEGLADAGIGGAAALALAA
jgi:hypothetical protein